MALDDLLQAIFSVFHQIHWCMEIAFMIDMITKLFNNVYLIFWDFNKIYHSFIDTIWNRKTIDI